MKKFKLVKTYPGSPEIGTVARKVGDKCLFTYRHLGKLKSLDVSQYPEFWEEIKEDEPNPEAGYEILSYKLDGEIYEYTEDPDLMVVIFFKEARGHRKYCFRHVGGAISSIAPTWQVPERLEIHSVKRLSDGQIFTVGDRTQRGIIQEIKKYHTGKLIIQISNWTGFFLLENLQPATPLFKTEDGVDIFVADEFYYIGDAFNIYKTKCLYSGDGNFTKFKKFSTEEQAKEYVWENKPCLSFREIAPIIGMCNNNTFIDLDKLTSKIKTLVNEKSK